MDNNNSHHIIYNSSDLLQQQDFLLKIISSVPAQKRERKSTKDILKEIDKSCKEMCEKVEKIKQNSFK